MTRWFFSHAFVDIYASQLIAQFEASVPADASLTSKKKLARKHVDRTNLAVQQLIAGARRFQKDEKLNFFQRARLAQQVQDRMISLGYSVEMSRELAAALSKATSSAT